MFKEPTSIELETYSALSELGIKYFRQHSFGRYIVDAFLPELATVIEVQGDYWHCNPVLYPDGPITVAQRDTIRRDEKRFAFLARNNYRVIQLWERDIKREGARALLERALSVHVEDNAA